MVKSRNSSLSQVNGFDVRLLCTFRTVAEHGSFSAVESTPGLSRLTISLHMSNLEKRLGMRLCQCSRAGFAPTDEGRKVYRVTQTLSAALEGLRARVNDLYQCLCGELNVGIINNLVTLSQMRIAHALSTFEGQGPQVRISTGMITPNEIELGVLDGYLHVGVAPLISPLSGLEYLPLHDEHAQLYCSRDHVLLKRIDGDIVADEAFATDIVAPSYRLLAEAQACHQELNNSVNVSDHEGMAFLTLTDNFIGYLPPYYAADWVAAGMLRFLLPERFHYVIVLTIVIHKGRRPNLVLERFPEAVTVSQGHGLGGASFGRPPNSVFSLTTRGGGMQ